MTKIQVSLSLHTKTISCQKEYTGTIPKLRLVISWNCKANLCKFGIKS